MNLVKLLDLQPYLTESSEQYMSELQREHFRKLLSAWRDHLVQAAETTVNFLQNDTSKLPDQTDNATKEEEMYAKLRKQARDSKLIKRITSCIRAIEQKDYGFCESCGAEIGIRRLEARPVAKECVDCKTLAEEKEKVS